MHYIVQPRAALIRFVLVDLVLFLGMLLFQGIFIFKTFPSQWTVSSDVLALLCGRSCRLVECKSKRLIKRKKEDEFNWRWLLSFLWSEKWILTAAIVVRRCYNKSVELYSIFI